MDRWMDSWVDDGWMRHWNYTYCRFERLFSNTRVVRLEALRRLAEFVAAPGTNISYADLDRAFATAEVPCHRLTWPTLVHSQHLIMCYCHACTNPHPTTLTLTLT